MDVMDRGNNRKSSLQPTDEDNNVTHAMSQKSYSV